RIGATIDAAVESHDLRERDGVEETLALALREAVTNVVRHSKASRASIRAWRTNGTAHLEVTDDGRGVHGAEGNGLRGMRERVEAIDGHITLTTTRGTRSE